MNVRHIPAVLAALAMLVPLNGATAQTPSSTESLAADPSGRRLASVAASNPWVLATQVAARFAGQGEFTNSLLVANQVIYDIPFDRPLLPAPAGAAAATPASGWTRIVNSFRLPVSANLGAVLGGLTDANRDDQLAKSTSALLSTAQGISFGLHPYAQMSQRRNLEWIVFGAAQGKVNSLPPVDTTDSRVELMQGRFSIGSEFRIGLSSATVRPLTVGGSFVHSRFSGRDYERAFGERRSSLNSGEFTLILPLQSGTGIVVESVIAQDLRPAWRFGLLLTPPKKPATQSSGQGADLDGGGAGAQVGSTPATGTTSSAQQPRPGDPPPATGTTSGAQQPRPGDPPPATGTSSEATKPTTGDPPPPPPAS